MQDDSSIDEEPVRINDKDNMKGSKKHIQLKNKNWLNLVSMATYMLRVSLIGSFEVENFFACANSNAIDERVKSTKPTTSFHQSSAN